MKTPNSAKGSRAVPAAVVSLIILIISSPETIAQVENSALEPIYKQIEEHLYLQAEQELDIYLQQNSQDAEAWQLLGTARQGRWDFKEAAEAYQRALDLGRENAPLLRGWIESEGRSLSKVSLIFSARRLKNAALRALELDPYHVETRGLLAAYYYVLPHLFGGGKTRENQLVEELVQLSRINPSRSHSITGQKHWNTIPSTWLHFATSDCTGSSTGQ
jgi:tetratricopeptide (TPR) repeat protein